MADRGLQIVIAGEQRQQSRDPKQHGTRRRNASNDLVINTLRSGLLSFILNVYIFISADELPFLFDKIKQVLSLERIIKDCNRKNSIPKCYLNGV